MHTTVPTQPKSADERTWDSSTVVELTALLLTIPGAIAALATLWLLHRQHQTKKKCS